MKIRDTYLLKEAGGSYFLFPVGQNAVDFKRMLELNETGYYIANQLLNDISYDDLLKKICFELKGNNEYYYDIKLMHVKDLAHQTQYILSYQQ